MSTLQSRFHFLLKIYVEKHHLQAALVKSYHAAQSFGQTLGAI